MTREVRCFLGIDDSWEDPGVRCSPLLCPTLGGALLLVVGLIGCRVG